MNRLETPKINAYLAQLELVAIFCWLVPIGVIFSNNPYIWENSNTGGKAGWVFYCSSVGSSWWRLSETMDGGLEPVNLFLTWVSMTGAVISTATKGLALPLANYLSSWNFIFSCLGLGFWTIVMVSYIIGNWKFCQKWGWFTRVRTVKPPLPNWLRCRFGKHAQCVSDFQEQINE